MVGVPDSGVAAPGDATGRMTDSAVAPMRVAVTGGSTGTTSSKVTLLAASRAITRGWSVPDHVCLS